MEKPWVDKGFRSWTRLKFAAQRRLKDWAAEYSGFNAHMAEAHPVIGYLQLGEVRFQIKTLKFREGRAFLGATANSVSYGRVGDAHVRVTDPDGAVCWESKTKSEFLGLKTGGSTWELEYNASFLRDPSAPVSDAGPEGISEVSAKYPPPD